MPALAPLTPSNIGRFRPLIPKEFSAAIGGRTQDAAQRGRLAGELGTSILEGLLKRHEQQQIKRHTALGHGPRALLFRVKFAA
jgi:hypothetical protein